MPRLSLTDANRQQLNDWLYGGPTDPTGIIPWLAANAATANPDVVYQAEGERDLYLLLLTKDGMNVRKQDITQKMADAVNWIEDSLVAWEALGLEIEPHQAGMRPLWNFLRQL